MKKYFLLMLLSAGSVLAKDTVSSSSVLPEKVLKLGEDQQKLITFLRKSKMLKGKQKQGMLFLVLSQMKNSNFQQVCEKLGVRLKGKKARITIANRKKFQNFFKQNNTADISKAYSSLAQSYLKSSGVSDSVSGTLPSEKKVEELLKQAKFEDALTQAKNQAQLTKASLVWGKNETPSDTPQSFMTYYLPYVPSTKDFVEVLAAAREDNASLITNVALRSQFEKKLLNPTDKMENESLNQQVEDVFQAKRRVEQIQADLGTRTIDLATVRVDLGLLTTELATRTTEWKAARKELKTANRALTNIGTAFKTAGLGVSADLPTEVGALLKFRADIRTELAALVRDSRIKFNKVGHLDRESLRKELKYLEKKYREEI